MKRYFFVIIFLLAGSSSFSQIAPDCAGVEIPAGYDEDWQRAFMQNYYVALFMPLPFINWHPSDVHKSNLGFDLSYIPKLSCQERLVMKGTKTENTSQIPLLARIQAKTELFSWHKLSLSMGFSLLPPLPISGFSFWYSSAQTALSYEPILGVALHARGFINLAYLNSEIAGPFSSGDPIKNDWFNFASVGSDLTASFLIPLSPGHKFYPFISLGVIKSASIFVVGDDDLAIANEKYPLLDATNFSGLSYHAFNDALQISLSAGGVIGTAMTGHLQVAYGF